MRLVSAAVLAAGALSALLTVGPAHADARRVSNVNTISDVEISGRFKVEIARGDEAGATLEGATGELERLGVRYSNGRLRVWEKCTVFCSRRDVNVVVRVVSPRIDAIEVSKGAEVTVAGAYGPTLTLDVAMGGSLAISGSCDGLEAAVAMGGSLAADNLACRAANVDAAMGGAASVRASETVTAEASMGGAIAVHGKPRVSSSTAMGGTVSMED